MRITATTTFLDGRDRFEKDDTRTVPDADGARFIAAGWAVETGSDPASVDTSQPAADLDIHSVTQGQESDHG